MFPFLKIDQSAIYITTLIIIIFRPVPKDAERHWDGNLILFIIYFQVFFHQECDDGDVGDDVDNDIDDVDVDNVVDDDVDGRGVSG